MNNAILLLFFNLSFISCSIIFKHTKHTIVGIKKHNNSNAFIDRAYKIELKKTCDFMPIADYRYDDVFKQILKDIYSDGLVTDDDIEEIKEEIGQDIDDSYFDVLFEDVRAYLKDATDEIESEIQEKYLLDNVRCYFDVYNIDETFTDFKFVFLVSFKEIKIASLTNLSKIIGKRQLSGASKFYS